jgi:RNA polymerase sigma-70 factor (ECF subfamily)
MTDAELLHQAKAGNLAAFEALVDRYERRVFTLARRVTGQEQDAEDVTQQTFINALEHLADFREEASFSTWILRIATYAALKVLRKRKGLPMISLDDSVAPDPDDDYAKVPRPEYIADWRAAPDRLAHQHETQRLIDVALAELDDKHRLVFLLRDVEGLSVRETADALRITEANVKVRLLRARLQLRERLTQTLGDPRRRVEPHRHE